MQSRNGEKGWRREELKEGVVEGSISVRYTAVEEKRGGRGWAKWSWGTGRRNEACGMEKWLNRRRRMGEEGGEGGYGDQQGWGHGQEGWC